MRAIAAPSGVLSGAASVVQMPLRRAPPHTFAVMAPTLVHFCTKFAEKKEGLARQKRLERHYRWVARVPVRAARFANATDMAATARAAPCRRQRPQPYEVETHSRSHSLLQSRASATVRPCGGGVRNSSSGCICEFAKCIERDRRRGASVAPYALRYSCCRHCRLLLLYRLSHRLLLLLLQTRLAIYTLCVQYTKQDRNAQCNVRNFYDAFFLILSGPTSSWVGTYFV